MIFENVRKVTGAMGGLRRILILPALLMGTAAYGYYKSYQLIRPYYDELMSTRA